MASADAMEATRRVQESMTNMINDLDKSHIRKIQVSVKFNYLKNTTMFF